MKAAIDDDSYPSLVHALDSMEDILLDCKNCCNINSDEYRSFGSHYKTVNGIKMAAENIEYESDEPFDPIKSKEYLNTLEKYLKKGFRNH